MGALIIFYIVGSFVVIPFLAYQLLRTRRDLNTLRGELRARGVIAPGYERTRAALAAPRDDAGALGQGDDI